MGKRKVRIGQVVSDKMDKTVVVAVKTIRPDPLYRKNIRRVKKYKVHDENNACHVGYKVKITETRPLSKEKRWRVAEIISRGRSVTPLPQITNVTNNFTLKENDSELHQAQSSG